MTDGRCPFAVWRGDDGMFGYPQGTTGQCDPLLFVDHIMAGHKTTLDGPWRLNAGVDIHFGIGRDGSISQYTNIFDAAWGNGVAGARFAGDKLGIERYDRSNRHLKAIETEGVWREGPGIVYIAGRGGSLLNIRSISTEHEGFPFDRPGFDATWPEPMIQASIRVKKWCIAEYARVGRPMPPVDKDLLAGHFQIDGVNRGNCPGPEWPKARMLSELKAEEGDDMPKYVTIAGLPEVYEVRGGSLEHVNRAAIELVTGTKDPKKWGVEDLSADHKVLDLPVIYPGGVPPRMRKK